MAGIIIDNDDVRVTASRWRVKYTIKLKERGLTYRATGDESQFLCAVFAELEGMGHHVGMSDPVSLEVWDAFIEAVVARGRARWVAFFNGTPADTARMFSDDD